MSCLSLGGILNAGFEQVLVLYNPIVYSTGDILDTYVYRYGILQANYSISTAVGLFKSVIGFGLMLLSYWLADRLANYRVF
jgi:putative aldouronate transport system permease protein